MEDVKKSKKVNYFVVFFGISTVLVLQTWLSVLNAQQAYVMSEARSDEVKILRVLDRMEEFNNYFNSSEYLYVKSYEESKIVLTPKDTIINNDVEPVMWRSEPVLDDVFVEKETELNSFLSLYEGLLPERGKEYFTPLNETLSSNPIGKPVVFVETVVSSVLGFVESLGVGFEVEKAFEEGKETSGETIVEVVNEEEFKNKNITKNEELGVSDLLPAPNTH
jgi:hypothetical protein